MKASLHFFAPDYYSEFICTGDRCTDNCCQGWDIFVEDDIVKKYKKHDKKYGTDFSKNIITTDSGRNLFQMNSEGKCPRLGKDGLCQVVNRMGPAGLSDICNSYPRNASIYKSIRRVVLSMTLSCPEVVRLSILEDRPIVYREMDSSHINLTGFAFPDRGDVDDSLKKAITDGFSTLIQERSVSFTRRMTTLLLLSAKADNVNALESRSGAKELLAAILHAKKTKMAETPELPGNYSHQFSLFTKLAHALIHPDLRRGNNKERFFQMIDRSFNGIGITDLNKLEQKDLEAYVVCQQYYVDRYITENPHVLENYVNHMIIGDGFPYRAINGARENFLKIAAVTMLSTGLLGGYAHRNKEINDDLVIEVIHTIHRSLIHGNMFDKKLAELCKRFNEMDLANIYVMFAR